MGLSFDLSPDASFAFNLSRERRVKLSHPSIWPQEPPLTVWRRFIIGTWITHEWRPSGPGKARKVLQIELDRWIEFNTGRPARRRFAGYVSGEWTLEVTQQGIVLTLIHRNRGDSMFSTLMESANDLSGAPLNKASKVLRNVADAQLKRMMQEGSLRYTYTIIPSAGSAQVKVLSDTGSQLWIRDTSA